MTPNTMFKFKSEKCVSSKKLQNCSTVLMCANMSRMDQKKKNFFTAGEPQKPRCFKNANRLPVEYIAHKKAQLTSDTFKH
jgi:hypothetical protein